MYVAKGNLGRQKTSQSQHYLRRKCGRLLLLREILDTVVKCYIRAVQDRGGLLPHPSSWQLHQQ